jgi:signal transduction histidine kinase
VATLTGIGLALAAFTVSLTLFEHGGLDVLRGADAVGSSQGRIVVAPSDLLLVAVTAFPLVAWRRFASEVFVTTAVASILLVGRDAHFDLALGPAIALYLFAASNNDGWPRRNTVLVVALFLAFLVASTTSQGAFPGSELLHNGLIWAVAWFAGERTRLYRRHVADLTDRARRVERDAERERQLAAAEERARIARDLHDSAGHAINVIAVRAGAARLRHGEDPDRSLAALTAIEELARQTAEDIDHIVGTLRDDRPSNGSVDAPPGLGSLDTLVTRQAEAGLHVTVEVVGTARTLGVAADQAAYRILQEALTNAARHGSGGARVELTYDDDTVEVTVTNPVRAGPPPRSGGGHGLVGMRERATLVGGSLDTQRTEGTFRLWACIPDIGRAP